MKISWYFRLSAPCPVLTVQSAHVDFCANAFIRSWMLNIILCAQGHHVIVKPAIFMPRCSSEPEQNGRHFENDRSRFIIVKWFAFSLIQFTYDDEMMHRSWCCSGEVPYCFSKSSAKFQGHAAPKNRRVWPRLSVSGLLLQFEFTNGYEMMNKAWSSIEELPYCF